MSMSPEAQTFIQQAIFRMEENLERIQKCLKELQEEEVWKRPNPSSNSVANLIIHLSGNITQYIIASLGEQEDQRDRDAEFAAKDGLSKSELANKMNQVIHQAILVIKTLDHSRLNKMHSVQGFDLSGIGIILHVVEHLSYHTGQITFWTKLLKDIDLAYYAGIDLNQKNVIE